MPIAPPQMPNYTLPQTDVLSQLARVGQLKQMQGEQQLLPLQIQEQQQRAQQAQIQTQTQQLALQDQQAKTAAMKAWDGKDMNDLPDLIKQHGGSADAVFGMKSQLLGYQKQLSDATEASLKNESTKNDMIAGHLDALKNVSPDQQPQAFQSAVADLVKRGYLDPQTAQAMKYPGPDGIDALEKTYTAHSAQVEQALKDKQGAEATAKAGQATAEGEKAKVQTEQLQKYGSPEQQQSKYIAIQAAQKMGQAVSKEDQAFAGAYEKNKTLVPAFNFNMQSGSLDKDAVDLAANNYLQTGQMPAGMRSPAMSHQILNRAGELAQQNPELHNLASNKAAYEANTDSLKGLQKNFDQVTAFENTAGKNLDQFLTVAQKAIDGGSPWVNKPLRTISQQGLGSADLAAFNAARTTAITEIAKVLNSSNASGVLSDSARSEVSELIGPNATLGQITSAAKILKTDMSNRHDSYAQQIGDIKSRLNPTEKAKNTEAPQQSTGHKINDVVVQGGHNYVVDAVDANGKPTKAHLQ